MSELKTRPKFEGDNSQDTGFAELTSMAERELGAFVRAVTELFGADQARVAAEDWIEELELMDCLHGLQADAWRNITIAAAARLARRLNPASIVECR